MQLTVRPNNQNTNEIPSIQSQTLTIRRPKVTLNLQN